MEELILAYRRDRREVQRFGLGVGLLFSVLAAAAFFRGRPELVSRYWPVALALIGLALLFPLPLWPLQRLAAFIIRSIQLLTTQISLIIVFYGVFTPMGMFMRLLGKDMLDRKIEPERESYWIPRERKEYEPEDDEKQF